VQFAIIFGINFATNWTSNAATTIIAMPIVAALAGNLHVNPLLLLVPVRVHS
jgi:sodium-dependent dicarboxylate transporter 2/3/5